MSDTGRLKRDVSERRRLFVKSGAVLIALNILRPADVMADQADRRTRKHPDALQTARLEFRLSVPYGQKVPREVSIFVKEAGAWKRACLVGDGDVQSYTVHTIVGESIDFRIVAVGYRDYVGRVRVERRSATEGVVLVPEGWPFFLMGGVPVPFEGSPRIAAVAFEKGRQRDAEISWSVAEAERRGFRRVKCGPDRTTELDDVNSAVLYFEPKDGASQFYSFGEHDKDPSSSPAVQQLILIFRSVGGRVGYPVDTNSGRVKIIDGRFVISFCKDKPENYVKEFAEGIGALLVGITDPVGGFWVIEFVDKQNLGRHLDVIAEKVRSGQLRSGEPDLLLQFKTHACAVCTPNDPYLFHQEYLERQKVREAWKYIEDSCAGVDPYGAPSVRIATIDLGVSFASAGQTSAHPEIDAGRLGYCYNVQENLPCEGADSARDHGMATYGIISAKGGNGRGIVGMASHSTHIAIRFMSIYRQSKYAETLSWVAGVRQQPPTGATPSVAIQPADVINCSHGLEGLPVGAQLDAAIERAAREGRNGLGTVVVYSAGNGNDRLVSTKHLATHPDVLGVGCTSVRAGAEVRWTIDGDATLGSNYGDYIDICANGHLALSLTVDPDVEGPTYGDGVTDTGVFEHTGTSAASAMVAAAASLVLSVNPNLTATQVREILRASAQKIDCGNTDVYGQWKWEGDGESQLPASPELARGLDWFSEWYGYGRLDVMQAVMDAHQATTAL